MRTTITIEVDNAEEIERLLASEKSGRAMKKVINHLLRLGLRALKQDEPPAYEIEVLDVQFRPGWDLGSLNRIAQEMEEADDVRKFSDRP